MKSYFRTKGLLVEFNKIECIVENKLFMSNLDRITLPEKIAIRLKTEYIKWLKHNATKHIIKEPIDISNAPSFAEVLNMHSQEFK